MLADASTATPNGRLNVAAVEMPSALPVTAAAPANVETTPVVDTERIAVLP